MKKFFVLFLAAVLVPAFIGCTFWGGNDDDGSVAVKTVSVYLPASDSDTLASLRLSPAASKNSDVKFQGEELSYVRTDEIASKSFELWQGNVELKKLTGSAKLEYKRGNISFGVLINETKAKDVLNAINGQKQTAVTLLVKSDTTISAVEAPLPVSLEEVNKSSNETKEVKIASSTKELTPEELHKSIGEFLLTLINYEGVKVNGEAATASYWFAKDEKVLLVPPTKEKITLDDYCYEAEASSTTLLDGMVEMESEAKVATLTMPAEALTIELVWKSGEVAPAILHDCATENAIADDKLAEDYYLTQGDGTKDGGNKIFVHAKNVKKHTAANNVASNWVGVAFLAPDGATMYKAVVASDTMPDNGKIEAAAATAIVPVTKDGSKKGYADYWGENSQKSTWYVGIQWMKDATNALEGDAGKPVIYIVDFKNVTCAAD